MLYLYACVYLHTYIAGIIYVDHQVGLAGSRNDR